MSAPAPAEYRLSWDSTRPGGTRRGVLLTIAAVAVGPAMAATLMQVVPPTDDATAMVAAFSAYGVLGYAIALLCLVIVLFTTRRRLVVAGVALVVAMLAAIQVDPLVPMFVPDHRAARTPPFTVFSLNMYDGNADPAQVVAAASQADIVVLLETTPTAVNGLRALGWDQRFPYMVGAERDFATNSAVFSRFPLGKGTRLPNSSFDQWMTTVDVPEVGEMTLVAAHPCNPFCQGGRWYDEHEQLNRLAAQYAGRPLVLAGDFNAVDEHGPMQALRREGLRSATDLVGAGWLPTWPANRSFPPLLPIDHVYVNAHLTATAIRSVPVAHTDHRGVLATLAGT